jgi:16S rRNA (adenine1518-N6/adenine1519-N6)-dimethyltransferase
VARGAADRHSPPVRKSLGQHFIRDRGILTRIADAATLTPDDTVVEIGPGRGALTDLLRERAARVVAIEYDRMLAQLLRERYANDTRVRIVEADVLRVDLGAVAEGPYTLVGNVPYYITTPILFHSLRPARAKTSVFLVQREVADRITADPGGREYGALSVNIQAIADVRTLFRVPAGAFQPPPKVDSAVIRIVPRDRGLVPTGDEQAFREMVQGIFGLRRKQMRRVLRELYGVTALQADEYLRAAGVEPDARPETLSPATFASLFERLKPLLEGDAGAPQE